MTVNKHFSELDSNEGPLEMLVKPLFQTLGWKFMNC